MIETEIFDEGVYTILPTEIKKLSDNFEGRQKDIVLLSILGVLSNCFPNIKGVYDGKEVSPHLYVLIVAPPASGKGVMNYSRLIIQELHNEVYKQSFNAYQECSKQEKKKGETIECPSFNLKVLPANSSSAEVYSYLDTADDGLLIMESEADTLSSMFANDWSNYSDVLRKVFHHETISITRKMDKAYFEIFEPKLSILLSGTRGQVQPLLKSTENGLYSRFIIYSFDEYTSFKNVFQDQHMGVNRQFVEMGSLVKGIYFRLLGLSSVIKYSLSENQKSRFLEKFGESYEQIVNGFNPSFLSNLNRHGLIAFRISMILTTIRNHEGIENVSELICSDDDFNNAIRITEVLLKHSLIVYNELSCNLLNIVDKQVLDSLNTSFNRAEAIEAGVIYNVPKRTIDDKLSQWVNRGLIKRLKKGSYLKTDNVSM